MSALIKFVPTWVRKLTVRLCPRQHALAMIDAALKTQPDDPQALYVRGQILAFALDRPEDARKDFERAYAAVVREMYFVPDVHLAYAKCLVMLGERAEAREVLDGCISIYPDELDAWLDRGAISKDEGDFAAAIRDTREVLKRDPNHPIGVYNLACYLALAGESDAALDALERAIEISASNAEDARQDDDFRSLRKNARFRKLTS